jgi:hypothetical protein
MDAPAASKAQNKIGVPIDFRHTCAGELLDAPIRPVLGSGNPLELLCHRHRLE